MKYRTRTYYTAAQKTLMWERWKEGWTLHQIGHLFDRPHTSIHTILSKTGGLGELGLTITDLALAAKSEIDKIREQSLNLE